MGRQPTVPLQLAGPLGPATDSAPAAVPPVATAAPGTGATPMLAATSRDHTAAPSLDLDGLRRSMIDEMRRLVRDEFERGA